MAGVVLPHSLVLEVVELSLDALAAAPAVRGLSSVHDCVDWRGSKAALTGDGSGDAVPNAIRRERKAEVMLKACMVLWDDGGSA